MITAAELADALTSAFVELQPGAARSVIGLEMVEPDDGVLIEPGDLVLLLGARTQDEVLGLVERSASCVGIGPTPPPARTTPRSVNAVGASTYPCSWWQMTHRGPGSSTCCAPRWTGRRRWWSNARWTSTATCSDGGQGECRRARPDHDRGSDARACWPTPRDRTTSTRRVRRASWDAKCRARCEPLPCARRLPAGSPTPDEPFFVPEARRRCPAAVRRAGARRRRVARARSGRWSTSPWTTRTAGRAVGRHPSHRPLPAAAEGPERAAPAGAAGPCPDAAAAATASDRPGWLGEGPWRVGILVGTRRTWRLRRAASCGRCSPGGRAGVNLVVADLDGAVYAVVHTPRRRTGTWQWLPDWSPRSHGSGRRGQRRRRRRRRHGVKGLPGSRAEADEAARLEQRGPVSAVEELLARLVLARAYQDFSMCPAVSPVSRLGPEQPPCWRRCARSIDYWGEPQRAAAVLGRARQHGPLPDVAPARRVRPGPARPRATTCRASRARGTARDSGSVRTRPRRRRARRSRPTAAGRAGLQRAEWRR